MTEKKAPWRGTLPEDWSAEIDPAVMAGGEWAEEGDAGPGKAVTKEKVGDITVQSMMGRFMHPQHDADWGDD